MIRDRMVTWRKGKDCKCIMGDFNELIKNFDRIRDYMRDFYVYGFKVRGEYTRKSLRTYDNERRRIESFLKDYIQYHNGVKGKSVFIAVDSGQVFKNPLYAAWKAKSFTANDIMLHFFIMDLLKENQLLTVDEIGNQMIECYGEIFDVQIIRLKLKEYAQLGVLQEEKSGKGFYYRRRPYSGLEQGELNRALKKAIQFFQESAPFGFVGSTLMDSTYCENDTFSFKHHFLVHTLEDGILSDVLRAMKEKRRIELENKSSRTGNTVTISGVPLKIMVSTQTGRRYVCIYRTGAFRFTNMRLDSISKVRLLENWKDYDNLLLSLKQNLPKCWGVTFDGLGRLEEIHIKLHIDEKREQYVIQRLEQEKRDGEIIRIRDNEFLYSGAFFDTNEILPWVKTFIGRIMDIQGTNQYVISKLYKDMDDLYNMYCVDNK